MRIKRNKVVDKVYTLEVHFYKYGEYELVGVFTSKAKAEMYLATHYKKEQVESDYIGEWNLC